MYIKNGQKMKIHEFQTEILKKGLEARLTGTYTFIGNSRWEIYKNNEYVGLITTSNAEIIAFIDVNKEIEILYIDLKKEEEIENNKTMKLFCNECEKIVEININAEDSVGRFPLCYECVCGSIFSDKGKDITKEYYSWK